MEILAIVLALVGVTIALNNVYSELQKIRVVLEIEKKAVKSL